MDANTRLQVVEGNMPPVSYTHLDGIPEGYIVISMRAENFEKVLHDKGNAKAEVAIMDPFWRTIYNNGNLQEEQIREELMVGHKLLGVYRAGELLASRWETVDCILHCPVPACFQQKY